MKRQSQKHRILDWILKNPGRHSSTDISRALNIPAPSVRRVIQELRSALGGLTNDPLKKSTPRPKAPAAPAAPSPRPRRLGIGKIVREVPVYGDYIATRCEQALELVVGANICKFHSDAVETFIDGKRVRRYWHRIDSELDDYAPIAFLDEAFEAIRPILRRHYQKKTILRAKIVKVDDDGEIISDGYWITLTATANFDGAFSQIAHVVARTLAKEEYKFFTAIAFRSIAPNWAQRININA